MKRLLSWSCLLLLPWVAAAQLSPIFDPATDPTWRELFATLSQPVARYSIFEEHRTFPFKRKPLVLNGEMRHAPGRGVSLHYLSPEPHTLIVDDQGVLFRDARGRDRAPPRLSEANVATGMLRLVLRFDVRGLNEVFAIRGRRDETQWTLELVPRATAEPSAAASSITLQGRDHRIQRIAFAPETGPRIEIKILETHEGVAFGESELKRHFR